MATIEVPRDMFQVKATELCAAHEAADRLIQASKAEGRDPDEAKAMAEKGRKDKAAAEKAIAEHYKNQPEG